VKSDQAVIMVNMNEDDLEVAKEALKRGGAKLPIPCRIIIEKIGE
jgi:large subunit ribosomal protein L10e